MASDAGRTSSLASRDQSDAFCGSPCERRPPRQSLPRRDRSVTSGTRQTMTQDEIRATVLRILGEIAPEADLTRLKSNVSFRDQLDIDSMDFLNFVIALDEELDVRIP